VEKDDRKITLLNILANTARGTQNPIDVARALKKALDAGATEEELAAATGHTVEWVRFYLLLNDLPEEYQEKLKTGELKVGHIREALRLPTPQEVEAALQTTLSLGWNVSTLKYYVDRRLAELQMMQARGESIDTAPPPSLEEAHEIVTTAKCPQCQRIVEKDQMYTIWVCRDCLTLLKYCLDQLGEPKRAMNEIYEAVSFYRWHKEREKMRESFGVPMLQQQAYNRPQPQPQTMNQMSLFTQENKPQPKPSEDTRIKQLEQRVTQLEQLISRSHQVLLKRIEQLTEQLMQK